MTVSVTVKSKNNIARPFEEIEGDYETVQLRIISGEQFNFTNHEIEIYLEYIAVKNKEKKWKTNIIRLEHIVEWGLW